MPNLLAVDIPNPVDVVTDIISAPAGWAWDKVAEGIANWVLGAVAYFVEGVVNFLLTSARPDVEAAWFSGPDSPYATVRSIAAVLLLCFVFLGIIQGLIASDVGGMIRRVAADLPASILGMMATTVVVGKLLELTDALSEAVLTNSDGQAVHFLSGFGVTVTGATQGFAAVLVGLVAVIAGLIVWVELMVRSVLVYILVALSPLSFAAMVWPSARGLLRRTVELLLAVILSKLVICIALSVGVAALSGAGTAGGPDAGIGDGAATSMGTLFVGTAILAMAAFAPFLVLKLIPWAEAALVAQGVALAGAGRAVDDGIGVRGQLALATCGRWHGHGAGTSYGDVGRLGIGRPRTRCRRGRWSCCCRDGRRRSSGRGRITGRANRSGIGRHGGGRGPDAADGRCRDSGAADRSATERKRRTAPPFHGRRTPSRRRPMTAAEAKPRHYRFGPRDTTGWLLGLGGVQCIALGAGVFVAGVALNTGAVMPIVVAPVLASAGFAFGRWNGRPIHELAPVALSWAVTRAAGRDRWLAEVPRFTRHGGAARAQPDLPPSLAELSIDETGAQSPGREDGTGVALIRDRKERTVSATLRVHGREFALCERAEQERLLHLWGDALAAFCAERGSVARIRWAEWAAPSPLDEQFRHLAECRRSNDESAPVRAYRELLDGAGPMATRHEVLVTVTVDERRLRRRRRGPADLRTVSEETLIDELRLLAARLDVAGLTADPPLSRSELAYVLRSRLDPYGVPNGRPNGRLSLVEHAGLVTVANAGPLAIETAWDHVRVDRSYHAGYVVAEWPRLEVPPAWMEPLLLHTGGIRTVAVHYEPVPPSRSQRQVDRETVKLSSDEEQRSRSGFRIGARHRRAQAEVLEREAELVAGYAEFEFVGFVVVTSPDLDDLERSCIEFEQAAAQSGLELRRLDGRHDLALACMLPIGRGVAPRRFA